MKREKHAIIAIFVAAFVAYLIMASRQSVRYLPDWTTTAYGICIALLVLIVVTVNNRIQLSRRAKSGENIDFIVRPISAIGYAIMLFLAFAGAAFLVGFFTEDFDRNFGRTLGYTPIIAVGLAIYSTAYFRKET